MGSSFSKLTGSSMSALDRRTVLKRAGQAGLAVTGASMVGIDGVLASRRVPAVLQDTEVSGTIKLLMNVTPDYMAGVFGAFNEQHPDVEVQAEGISSSGWADFSDQVVTRVAGGEKFDIVQIATEGQRLFASKGLLHPIDEYLARDEVELAEYFDALPPKFLELTKSVTAGGETYFLPGEFNTMGIWYNSKMFADAGVEEPATDWTWDDFHAAATAVLGEEGTFGMHVNGGLFVSVMPWLLTNSASPLNADWTEATVDTPEAIEAAQFMRSLVEEGVSPEPGGEFDAYTLMAQDKLAMFGAGRWPLANIRELEIVDKVKIAPWPRKTEPGSPIGWKSYPIFEVSENKEAAWAFAKFMTTPEASIEIAKLGTEVPPRREAIESDIFLENSPEGMDVLFKAVDYATPVPGPDNGAIIQSAIQETFDQILIGNVDAESALKDLNEDIQSEL